MAQQVGTKTRLNAAGRFCGVALLLIAQATQFFAQTGEAQLKKEYPASPGSRPRQVDLAHDKPLDPVSRAVGMVCRDRVEDYLSSTPIDVMQASASLPLKNSEVIAAIKRAESLLPLARELATEALRELAAEHNLEDSRLRAAEARIRAVTKIEPDVDLRDNASVSTNRPTVITFGTLFLVGLRSNEGMIGVLAHELTHLGDGKEDSLLPLFQKVGRRAAGLTGMRVTGRRAEELTCDLIGAVAARKHIVRAPSRDPLPRRLSRILSHNCVEHDETDDAHLSPRNTMRALLALDEVIAQGILGLKDQALLPFDWRPADPQLSEREAFVFASERCRSGL
jgi:hypothetical protein